jgi:hypothetical protein
MAPRSTSGTPKEAHSDATMMSAGACNAYTAAQNEAVQCNNHRLRIAVNGLKSVVVALVDRNNHVGICAQLFNIDTSAEALALCANDDDVDVAPGTQSLNFSGDTRPFSTVKGIYGRFIKDNLCNTCVN